MDPADLTAIGLTFKLAAIATAILLIVGTPLAWWLAKTGSKLRAPISAIVALPIVLPPSVLGFYLLVAMGPNGWFGGLTQAMGLGPLPFTFAGLVVASVLYSLPFVVQPLQSGFESLDKQQLEAAATLGAGPMDRFFSIVIPLCAPAFLTAMVLGFAHTLGEFGVVLMIGGNIPGVTQVISVQIYDHVEALDYNNAHMLSGFMLLFSFITLFLLYRFNPAAKRIST